MNVKAKYRKTDINEPVGFYDPPTTSCQDMIGLRTNDTSTDVGYPSQKYKFIKKLGDGSASTIHLGERIEDSKTVIIKMISKRDEWRKELSILKTMSESTTGRILKYLDYYESQRSSYIVTEFYEGFDLFEHIDLNVPYSEQQAYQLMIEMCKCIKECHDRGIVHLDIKCENFMVKQNQLFPIETGNVVLIDFGHAEVNKEDENIGELKVGFNYGTTFYLCPEGYEKIFSSKSDIWTLGVCLSLLLTSDYPFLGDEQEYMWNAVHEQIHLSKPVSKRSSVIISLCLQTDPDKRPTIDQLISMLEKL